MAVCLINKYSSVCIVNKYCRFFPKYSTASVINATADDVIKCDETNKNDDGQSTKANETYDADIKSAILTASLPYVNQHGWSKATIIEGAKQLNYPGTIHGLFPSPGAQLVQFFYTQSNLKLASHLKEAQLTGSGTKIAREAIECRLRMVLPYKEKWAQALAIMAMPQNVPQSLANLLTLADDICYYAGDRSVDLSWYSRRVGLAAIYKMVELFMLQDTSQDHKETWTFLEQRLYEASRINQVLKQSDSINNQAKETLTSAITMARNILGLNWKK